MTDEGGIFQIGGRSAKVLAGEAVFVLPGQLHTAVALEEMPCQYVSVVFHPSLFTDGEKGCSLLWKKYVEPALEGKILLPFHILKNSETGNRLLKDLYQIRTLFRKREAGDELLAK